MPKPFKGYDELNKYIKKKLEQPLEYYARIVQKEWKRYVREQWYDQYDPLYYYRQYAFLESLLKTEVKAKGNGYEVYVYVDSGKFDSLHQDPDKFTGSEVFGCMEYSGLIIWNFQHTEILHIHNPLRSMEYITQYTLETFKSYMKHRFENVNKWKII